MTQRSRSDAGPAHKTLEFAMALLIGVFGLIVIFGSL